MAAVAAVVGVSLTTGVAILSLAMLVVVMGLPHGALDFAIARLLGLCTTPTKIMLFMLGYISIVMLSVLFWLWLPAAALTVFLLISAHHFSTDWQQTLPYAARLSVALVVLCAPAILYAAELKPIFVILMLSPAAAELIIYAMQIVAGLSVAMLLGGIRSKAGRLYGVSGWQRAEILVLLLSGLVLQPLLHFALYFCFLHSTKHFQHTAHALNLTLRRALYVSLPFVILTLLGVLLVAQVSKTGVFTSDILRYIFIGLFGLTVSHMLLTEKWRQVAAATTP